MGLAELRKLATDNGIEIDGRWGVGKLQEVLIDAGVEFELVDEPSERELAEAAAEAEPEVVAAPKKSTKGVDVIVMVNGLHVNPRDIGRHEVASLKFNKKDRITIVTPGVAEAMEARDLVAIV